MALLLALLALLTAFILYLLLQTLGVLPLVIPPFVGAVAFQQILGRSGMENLLLLEAFGTTIPIMEGLVGVVLVQTLHYAPQACLRITTVGLNDVDGYVICVIMVALSLLALWGARRYLTLGRYATVQRGTTGARLARPVAGWRSASIRLT